MSSVRIAQNAVFNVIAFGANLVVNFLLIPVMIGKLGPTGFGVWAIVRVFVNYAALADLGLTGTITKYVAEYTATGRHDSIAKVLKSAFVLYAGMAVLLVGCVAIAEDVIRTLFFKTSGQFAEDVSFVLFSSVVIFATNMVFSVFPSALAGIQRMDLTNSVVALYSILNGILMYGALVMDKGLRGLVWANALATAVAIALNWLFFARSFRDVGLIRVALAWADIRKLFSYSKNIFVVAVASNVHQHLDKLLLSSFVNLNAVTSYEVASRLVQQVRQIPILMLSPLLPAASEVDAKSDSGEKMRDLYRVSWKYLVAATIPLAGVLGLFASPFIELWLGSRDEIMVLTLQILLISNFVNLLTASGFFISIGMGNARFPMYSSIVGLILNVVLSVVLIKIFGYFGAVFGSFSALILASLFFLTMVHRSLGIDWSRVLGLMVKPVAALLVGFSLGRLLGSFIEPLLLKFVTMVACSLAVYVVGLILFDFFDKRDKEIFRNVRSKIFRPLASSAVEVSRAQPMD